VKNPAAGGGRWVEVAPERFAKWISEFALRHGGAGLVTQQNAATITFGAADGSIAECHPPFPPLPALPSDTSAWPEAIAAHAAADRTVGVLLVRLGGYAVGVFAGEPPVLVRSKTGSRPVHGRSAAGGWSQHRFARRREKQASEALGATADVAAAIFSGTASIGTASIGSAGKGLGVRGLAVSSPVLDAVVLGGDRRAAAALREDPRLAPYLDRAEERFLTVPDPRLAVLRDSPRAFRAIRIRLTEPG
jgi:hypothetical protein